MYSKMRVWVPEGHAYEKNPTGYMARFNDALILKGLGHLKIDLVNGRPIQSADGSFTLISKNSDTIDKLREMIAESELKEAGCTTSDS